MSQPHHLPGAGLPTPKLSLPNRRIEQHFFADLAKWEWSFKTYSPYRTLTSSASVQQLLSFGSLRKLNNLLRLYHEHEKKTKKISAWRSRDRFKLSNFDYQTIKHQPPHKPSSIYNNQNPSTKQSIL